MTNQTLPLDNIIINPSGQLVVASAKPYSARLEYVKFENATIDTNILPDNDFTRVDVEFLCYGIDSGDGNYIVGNTTSSRNPWFSMEIQNSSNRFQCNLGSTTYIYWGNGVALKNQKYDFSMICRNGKVIFTGTYTNESNYSGSIAKQLPIQISPKQNSGYPKIYVYSCKIETQTQKMELIPVEDVNGIACMYDIIGNEFFYNVGSGRIVAGPKQR